MCAEAGRERIYNLIHLKKTEAGFPDLNPKLQNINDSEEHSLN